MNQQLITKINGIDIVTVEHDGEIYVPIIPIREAIAANYASQFEKLQTDDIFSDSVVLLRGITAADGKQYETLCLPLRLVYLWLGTLNQMNVSADARENVRAYRLVCARVLYDHFAGAATRQQEQNQVERTLLDRKAAALESIAGHKKGIADDNAEIRKLDEQLLKLQSERLNPQRSLFS